LRSHGTSFAVDFARFKLRGSKDLWLCKIGIDV
jgi:hypothetical protein